MEEGTVYYHGRRGPFILSEDRPIFFTSDREAAEWYAFERGGQNRRPCVYKTVVKVHNPAGYEELLAAVQLSRATKSDIKECSPYDGDSALDFIYVPKVRQELERMGFDGYEGWDVFLNREIPILVAFYPAQVHLSATLKVAVEGIE